MSWADLAVTDTETSSTGTEHFCRVGPAQKKEVYPVREYSLEDGPGIVWDGCSYCTVWLIDGEELAGN